MRLIPWHFYHKTSKTMQNSLFVQGGSQPLAAGKQPVGVLSNSN
jgi:hypothetical protein